MRRYALLGRITVAVVLLGAALALPSAAHAETLSFPPVADAYVDATYPTTSYGTSTAMWLDSSPRKQAFMRFDLAGLAGRSVVSARLRIYQRGFSDSGGRVFGMTTGTWTESVTWDTRPAIDGPKGPTFGAVAGSRWYEVDVTSLVQGDGPLNLALKPTSFFGARWQSRESSTPPQLIVEVESNGFTLDRLQTVAPAPEASSDPTYHASNHRLAKTVRGRLLTIHGRHGSGIQLAWRDQSSGSWSQMTRGVSPSGGLLSGTGTGDWPASIVTGLDSSGQEHAWVVWAGPHSMSAAPLAMVRLSDLDNPAGPIVGPTQVLDSLPGFRADIQFEIQRDGTRRAGLIWVRKNSETAFEILAGWLDSIDTATPRLTAISRLDLDTTRKRFGRLVTTTGGLRFGTLVATTGGLRAVIRSSSSRVRVWRHAADGPLSEWTSGSMIYAMKVNSPSAAALADGSFAVVSESDTKNDVVMLQRFTNDGSAAPVELTLTGYKQPSIASDGSRIWIVMVRVDDGLVVSREWDPSVGWTADDRIEIGPKGGGFHSWPNLMREVDDRLRFVVRGPSGTSTDRSSTLAVQRQVGPAWTG